MIVKEILPVLGPRLVAGVHYGDIKKLHEGITARGAPIRANRVLAVASKMFAHSLLPMLARIRLGGIKRQEIRARASRAIRSRGKSASFRRLRSLPSRMR
jgi:hypothetical protein